MKTVSLSKLGVALVAVAALAGCVDDTASYQVEGSQEHALVLMRQQRYFWSDNTDLMLVVARLPDCQRRHNLKPAPLPQTRVVLYEVAPNQFQLQQGDNWYVAETGGCTLQPLEAAPDAPGKLLGTFDRKDDRLRFIPAPPAAAAAAAEPAAAPAPK